MYKTASKYTLGSCLGLELIKHTYNIDVSRHKINLMGYAILCIVQLIYSVRYDMKN